MKKIRKAETGGRDRRGHAQACHRRCSYFKDLNKMADLKLHGFSMTCVSGVNPHFGTQIGNILNFMCD